MRDPADGYIDEHGQYRGADDALDRRSGAVVWGALLVAMLAAAGAFGWSIAQAFRLLEKLLGL